MRRQNIADKPLTSRQAAFVREYMIDPSCQRAAGLRAGYSEKNAKVEACNLLRDPRVIAMLAKRSAKIEKKFDLTMEDIVAELRKIAFANVNDYIDFAEGADPVINLGKATPDQLAALSEVSVEDFMDGRGKDARDVRRVRFKLSDKKGALVDLGKHLGGFVGRMEHTGKDGGPIKSETVTMTPEEAAEHYRKMIG